MQPADSDGPRRRPLKLFVAAAALVEAGGLWLRAGRIGGRVIVRCRQGHLFTTIWIPLASVKSLRLGLWRIQRCPAGHHWSLVTPVRKSDLNDDQVRAAAELRDLPLP